MRVQSGFARGRRIQALPEGLEVRPILARIRKSLFDILRPRIAGATFLDLFAGTGTVGIEALSNGADSAVFVDAVSSSCRMIEKNLAGLGFGSRARVVRSDATGDLSFLKPSQFSMIFMGPPYKDEQKRPLALTVPALRAVHTAGLAAPGGWVIGQHHKKEPLEGLPEGWEIFRTNNYGDSVLTFFRRKDL
jgi:16S rRNA (guanine(966)-N(2))-methyltransferase RsmD